MSEVIFAEGVIVKKNENAPSFVLCNLSIKVDEFEQFMKKNAKNGWVNLSLLVGQSGKPYAKLDTYEPKESSPTKENDGMPF